MNNNKRNESIFWMGNECPFCRHSAPVVYKPDLLKGPIDFECQSVKNPLRRYNPCYGKWSVAVDPDKRQEILDLLDLADKYDYHIREENKIHRILHKKDD